MSKPRVGYGKVQMENRTEEHFMCPVIWPHITYGGDYLACLFGKRSSFAIEKDDGGLLKVDVNLASSERR